jgi:Na+/H+ antiporter NhaD/arsenite permease-like protein
MLHTALRIAFGVVGDLGAAANVMVVQTASRQGVDVSMREWVRAGLSGTIATLLLATAALAMFA